MGKADLHTHTLASDGALTARELLEKGKKKGLKTISITDHDTISGFLDGIEIAAEIGIELIPGIEISTIWKTKEIHILAYGFDYKNEELSDLLRSQKRARVKRMKRIIKELQSQGIDITYDEVWAEAGQGNMGRPHAANVLVNKGYVSSFAEAFIRYLSSKKLDSIKTEFAEIDTVIKTIHNAGGVLSIAHPGPIYSQDEIDQLLSLGIDGIECIHPSHNFNVQKTFTDLAKSRNILVTGGSDFHGNGKSDYDPYFGIVTLGQQHVESVKRMSGRKMNLINSNSQK